MNLTSLKNNSCLFIIIILFITSGCSLLGPLSGAPRARMGYLPTATVGILFPNPDKLGKHAFGPALPSEVGGIVYTCKAGHIDLDHVRGNADNVRFLVKKIRQTLSKKRKGFSFNLTGEMSTHKIRFTYPEDWQQMSDKERIIDQIAYDTAAYLSFNATTWHEIQTWFGVHYAFIEPEFNSAFSWEDVYSNLIGVRVGVEAVKDTEHSFDEAMTIGIYKILKELDVQPRSIAIRASDKVRGDWYTGNFIPDMKMRNLDIGLDDGCVTPVLVPDINECNDPPLTLPVPTLDTLEEHGLSMTYEIKPNVLEQGKMFKAAGSKRIFPDKHFPIIMRYIEEKVIEKGYKYYK